jgi:DNA-binding MarR family transcriptional regulator
MSDSSRSGSGLHQGFLSDLVSYYIRLVQIAAYKNFEGVSQEYGVAPRYFGLLSLIETNPGMPQSRLAEAIHLIRSSLVPILDKLEADGLVERRSSDIDRRHKSVWLTARGKKIVGRLKDLVRTHEQRLLVGFSKQEKQQLLEFLKRIDLNLRKKSHAAAAA